MKRRSSLSSHEDYDGEVELIASINQDMLAISEEEFLRECSLCPEIIALKEQLMKPWSNNESSQLNKYFRLRKDLSVQEDLILNEKEKILVPVSLRNKLLSFAHKAHQGMVRTKQRLRESYWWPGMDKDVEDLVTNCWVCKNHDKRLKSIRVPITPVERPANPWTKLGLDIVGPFIDSEIGFRFAITLIDYTSKWPEVFCTNKTTSKVIINFLENVFSREGFPREIVTDNGTPFISEEFEDFLGSNGIKHIRTANYHPACNGEVENFNKTLKSTVLTAHLQHTEVKRTIQLFLREYRSTPHTVTKQTPSAVLHGRTLRTLVHVFDKEVETKPPEEACRQEDKSDSESKSCSPKLQVGDQVKVQAGDPVMKGRSNLRGPFTITKQLRPFTFVLSDGKVWNARRLRLYQKTISRRLVANGLHSCRPLRRLPLTPPNRRQRLEWCRARSTWMTEWHRVVFSDESRFCLSSDSRRVRVWRRRGERSNPAAIVERPTVRQRGIMVWGAIAYDSRSPLLRIQGTMTAQRYVDDVLRPVTLPYLQGVPNALYQQDNARPHTARISQQALQDVQMLPWPPYSPELSPIEHVWDIIGRPLHALPQPRSEDELWQMVEREWRAIPQDAICTLIDSLPRRVAACIAVRGGPTCY
ncbi:K02A2.6-like [Cordylochernes scorpioides]|uniref:RNA-directed DNA polymerase n=1 Tax=Cordylochernes scorpioides TaxID=51811 RepID=A0ABY6LW33_9ARAC|nr:K02A2.6-like [Cordylochernes scorpioides]